MEKRKLFIVGFLTTFLLMVAGFVLFANQLLQPVDSSATTREKFVIPSGQSVSRIAERLVADGIIRNALIFRGVVYLEGLDGRLQAGSFDLARSMSPAEIARALTQGTQDTWITIPEGWRMEEIAESLTEYELSEYDKEAFLDAAAGLEGQLFPDTYLIQRESTAEQIVALLQRTYQQKVVVGLADEIAQSDKPFDEILIMASLLEREAREYEQMRHVSGILWNRIEIGMPIQVDATLQYAKGYSASEQRWWSQPTREDKQITSPYNTYANVGLPPGPICNPGLQAFRAALDPLVTDDFYYLHAPTGEMYYGQTLDEHNANVQRYLR